MTWTPQSEAEARAGLSGEPPGPDVTEGEALLPATTADGRRSVVLVATMQLQVRAVGTTVLRSAGFQVQTETRGEAIVAALATRPPDLILTDLKLEDMDAASLCSRVREIALAQPVPILVISDFLHLPTIQEILAQDFTDLVSAPVNWKVLTFRINRWISMARKLRTRDDQDFDFEQVRDSARRASTELLQLRNYDSITGLPNRAMFLNTVELVVAQNERSSGYAAVLFVDIDDFKGVNDLIGRSLGDELLRIVAKRLQGCLREGDVVSQAGDEGSLASFTRLTGDQFAILLSSVQDQEAATAVAERLLASLARPLTMGDRDFRLTAKIGIAEASQLDEGGEEAVLQRAETAMRYCKQRKGKPWAFFESFMNELVLKKLELKAELRQALEQNQLFFCYQLLVESQTGEPRGVEALVRWQHPSRGLIPPNDFLPVAEESDLILEIDRWVLRNGCLQGKEWLDRGVPPILMSLNVSARWLEERDFAEQVLAIVEQTGLPPSSLQIEVSERGKLPDAGRIMPQFEMLVARGIHLALDDFGTGQTSLSYLRTLPITCVKVDRSFVRRIPGEAASVAIVTAIGAMAQHLGLKVVAEGVETEDHWRFLAENDYDQLQGFLFSRPERAEKMEERLRNAGGRQRLPAPRAEPVPPAATAPEEPRLEEAQPEEPRPEEAHLQAPRPEESWLEEAQLGEPRLEGAEPGEAPPEEPPLAVPRLAVSELEEPELAESRLEGAQPGEAPPEEPPGAARRDGADGWSQSEGYLLKLARNDFLTKLYNRFSFDERLEHAVAHADRFGHKVALLLIDLDDFKYVNDTHGHTVGDELLIAIAERLKGFVRRVDTLARIGGDEFAIILSECDDLRQVADFASRIRSMLAQPVHVEGRELRVTGSLGIAVYPAAGTEVKDLLRQADLALYKVKNSGGNNVGFFAREMDREVQRGLALARDLGGAVERGELYIEYQLQVELATGSIVGAEALVRWKHPRKGIIAPTRFIPIAESSGEIRAIGRWVIQSACREARRWRSSSGRDVRVSVNLSPVQCRDSRFVATILRTLREHELAPELLDLEVDERLLKHLPRGLEDSLRLLSELGVGLTLDNFGSGSSALEYFRRYHFDRLKIDRSLVQTIGRGSASTSVLTGIVALARKMNVQIVAEGIEQREDLERLRAEGCDQGQGFLFSRPLSADMIAEIMSGPGVLPGFRPFAGPSSEPDPASRRSVEEVPDLPDIRLRSEPGHDGGELLRLEIAELEDEGERVPASGEPSAGEEEPAGREPAAAELAAPPEPRPGAASPSAELRRLSSVAAPGAAALRRRRWRLLAALLLAALVVPGLYLLRPRASGSAAAVPEDAAPPAPSDLPVAVAEAAPEPAPPPPAAAPAEAAEAAEVVVEEPEEPAEQPLDLVASWGRAWSEQRVDDYLRLYAADFRPPGGLSREEWEEQRRARILRPERIELRLSAIAVEPIDDDRTLLSFDQSYLSDSYSDVVRKTLELVREEDGWRILEERVEE